MKKSENCHLEFYRCSVCGNLMIKLNNSGITPQCCGRDMEILVAGSVDGSEEHHVPIWKMDGCKVIVTVGEKPHPMKKEHYIQWIVLETTAGYYAKCLTDDDVPEACFKLCKNESVCGVYSFCNIHHLWKSDKEEKEYDCPLCGV